MARQYTGDKMSKKPRFLSVSITVQHPSTEKEVTADITVMTDAPSPGPVVLNPEPVPPISAKSNPAALRPLRSSSQHTILSASQLRCLIQRLPRLPARRAKTATREMPHTLGELASCLDYSTGMSSGLVTGQAWLKARRSLSRLRRQRKLRLLELPLRRWYSRIRLV